MSIRPSKSLLALGSAAFAFILSGCWGVEEDPGGTAASYTPRYLEPQGTVIPGEFFPLEAGSGGLLEGSLSGKVTVKVRGRHLGRNMDLDSVAPFHFPVSLSIQVSPPQVVQVSKGQVSAVPVTFVNAPLTEAPGRMGPAPRMTGYFLRSGRGVYFLGVADGRGGVKETPAPLHLNLPLEVGDTWKSALTTLPDLSFAGLTGEVRADARTYVVGRETVDLGGRTVEAVRLEQAADFTVSGASVRGIAVAVKGQFKGITHLADGLGQVRQQVFLRVHADGSVSQNGEKLGVSAVLELQGDIRAALGASARAQDPRAGSDTVETVTAVVEPRALNIAPKAPQPHFPENQKSLGLTVSPVPRN